MRLATFNLFSGRSLADGRVEPARLRSAIATLDADLLGLQEVDRGQARSRGLDLAAEAAEAAGVGVHGWRFAPALTGTPGEQWEAATGELDEIGDRDRAAGPAYGVALLSRLPVLSWHVVRLPPAPLRSPVLVPSAAHAGRVRPVLLPDEPRVAIAAVVEAPGLGRLTAAVTHLSFVPGWNLVQLRRLVRALARLPQPAVLLGDLNVPWRLPTLAASGWRSLGRAPTWPAPRPRVQFDHVLARGALPAVRSVQAVELPVSDHRGLVIDI